MQYRGGGIGHKATHGRDDGFKKDLDIPSNEADAILNDGLDSIELENEEPGESDSESNSEDENNSEGEGIDEEELIDDLEGEIDEEGTGVFGFSSLLGIQQLSLSVTSLLQSLNTLDALMENGGSSSIKTK